MRKSRARIALKAGAHSNELCVHTYWTWRRWRRRGGVLWVREGVFRSCTADENAGGALIHLPAYIFHLYARWALMMVLWCLCERVSVRWCVSDLADGSTCVSWPGRSRATPRYDTPRADPGRAHDARRAINLVRSIQFRSNYASPRKLKRFICWTRARVPREHAFYRGHIGTFYRSILRWRRSYRPLSQLAGSVIL